MKKITSQVTKVITSLISNGFTFEQGDTCPDEYSYMEVPGVPDDIMVGDDHRREQWSVLLENVKGPTPLSHLLVGVLGSPSHTTIRSGGIQVLNWEPSKNLLIVSDETSVEFYQDYTKT